MKQQHNCPPLLFFFYQSGYSSSTPSGKAMSAGIPYDRDRAELLTILFDTLKDRFFEPGSVDRTHSESYLQDVFLILIANKWFPGFVCFVERCMNRS
jgi:hypothetical protein